MQVLVQGILIDPSGNPLPNCKIKITSRSNGSSSFIESSSEELTNEVGEYSFVLTEGWKYIEILFNNTYYLTGDVTVNSSTPSPINLTELLEYSTPIEPDDIYPLSNEWSILQNNLENGIYTHYREDRDQLVDSLTHIINLNKLYISDDELERSAEVSNEVSSCDAKVVGNDLTYSDSNGNSFVQSSNLVSNKTGTYKCRTYIGESLIKSKDTSLGNYTDSKSTTLDNTGSIKVSNVVFDNYIKENTEIVRNGSYEYIEDITTPVGTVGSLKTINDSNLVIKDALDTRYLNEVNVSNDLSVRTYLTKVGDKELSEVFSNNGVTRTKQLILDNFKVGREGNTLFEVDNDLNRVTVRGSLRITDIEDKDGNPIDLPKDGNTIFQVFRYGETSTGPWEYELKNYHYWKQENTSVNGYIDPNGWSAAYKFRGEDATGNDGDTIYIEYGYSPDGSFNWTTTMKAGDAFRRERVITNGVAGPWSTPVRIKGTNGDEIEIRSQYSVDGVSDWHDNFVDGDIYERRARFVNGLIDSPWSDPFRIVGEAGIPGLNGSGWYSIVKNGGEWPGDTQAIADFINEFGRVPQLDDHLFYVDRDPNPTKTDGRRCITPVGEEPIQWNNPRAYFDGDVIVKGTLSADRLVAQSITGNEIDSQTTIIAGSGGSTAGINGYDLASLPAWMGGGSNPYAGYRIWAGSSTPEFANFTVDASGKMRSINGRFSGTITMIGTSGMKVESQSPFGPDNLLEWRGSKVGKILPNGEADLSKLTKVNATTYYSDDNVAYFGGTIIAGTLTTSKVNPSLSPTVEVDTGLFGSNGGQIAIACGFIYSYVDTSSGSCPSGVTPPEVLLTLYEVIGSSEYLVAQETFTGIYTCEEENGLRTQRAVLSGSFTFYESNGSTSNRRYILRGDRTGGVLTPHTQRLSIVSQEA